MVRVPKTLEKSCDRYKDIWSNKNELRADQVSLNCNKKFLFNCHNCGHSYEQGPSDKANKGCGCPFCSNRNLCGDTNCLFCLPKSCNIYSSIWSKTNDKTPQQVSLNCNKKFLFDCHNCGHEYLQPPSNKTRGNGCPFCSNRNLCGNKECISCLEKSCYIYKHLWSKKNNIESHQVSISNGKKFIFSCNKCNHEYYQSPNHKTQCNGCPFCSSKKLCENIKCLFCLSKSCNIYSDIWSSKNVMVPISIFISSSTKILFNCHNCGHEYYQTPANKTSGRGCPTCKNKTEMKVADFLKEIDVKFKKEFKIDSKKRYDFYLPDFNLIIEIDGDQHFRQVRNWKSYEDTIENDIQKMKTGIENGYSILRIYQPDIWEEKIDWKTIIIKNLYKRTLPDVTYISSNPSTYDEHLIYSSVV